MSIRRTNVAITYNGQKINECFLLRQLTDTLKLKN
jgi:hypothetical protein